MPPLTAAEFARLRGFDYFNAAQGSAPDHWNEMRKLGATLVRVWYHAKWGRGGYSVDSLQRADMHDAVDGAIAAGLVPVICVGVSGPDMPFAPGRAQSFVRLWRSLQRTHSRQPAAVFDLLNEPTPIEGYGGPGHFTDEQWPRIASQWRDVAMLTLGALFADAPNRLCVVQMGLGADPQQFALQRPLPMPNVVHSAHMYLPHAYTHHGVSEAHQGVVAAPVPLDESVRAEAMRALELMGAWSKQHGLPIYVGEFSAHNILPDAHEYVEMVTDYCNSRGWPWTYHDWRQWPGWHPSDETLAVLTRGFAA